MKFCPSIYAHTPSLKMRILKIDLNSTEEEILEACCHANIQCDERKRSELNHKIISSLRHCECEQKLRECLWKSVDYNLGVLYFAREYFKHTKKCYTVDYPVVRCLKYQREHEWYKRCEQYELNHDESKPKIYQTFDVAYFTAF